MASLNECLICLLYLLKYIDRWVGYIARGVVIEGVDTAAVRSVHLLLRASIFFETARIADAAQELGADVSEAIPS